MASLNISRSHTITFDIESISTRRMTKLNDKPSKLHKLEAGIFAIRILFMLYDFFFSVWRRKYRTFRGRTAKSLMLAHLVPQAYKCGLKNKFKIVNQDGFLVANGKLGVLIMLSYRAMLRFLYGLSSLFSCVIYRIGDLQYN